MRSEVGAGTRDRPAPDWDLCRIGRAIGLWIYSGDYLRLSKGAAINREDNAYFSGYLY